MKTNRGVKWAVFVLSGGYGWYQNVVAMGWLDKQMPDWLAVGLFFAAIGGGLWAANQVCNEVEAKVRRISAGWWKHLHGRARERRLEKAVKWMMSPLLLWMLPLLLAIAGLLGGAYG